MKNFFLFLLFIPIFAISQNAPIFSEKEIISEFNVLPNKSIQIRKTTQILKDSKIISESFWRCVLSPHDTRTNEVLGDYDEFYNLAIEAWKDVPKDSSINDLNVVLDTVEWIGDWTLILENQTIDGKTKLNNDKTLVFNSDKNQKQLNNIILNVHTNFITFKIGETKYRLLKSKRGIFVDSTNSIILKKKE